jgi:DNA segregation ATPase FtsK/SpoIIIE, S-DNA-T family
VDTRNIPARNAPSSVSADTVTLIPPPRLGSARQPTRWLPVLWAPVVVAAATLLIVFAAMGGPLLITVGLVIFVGAVGLGALCYAALWWGPQHTRRLERDRYLRYVDGLRRQLGKVARDQRDAAGRSHPSPDQLLDIARTSRRRFERRPGDADFGLVRVGLGTVDLAVQLREEPESNPLAPSDPVAGAAAADLRQRPRELHDMPVTLDLGAGITTLVGDPSDTRTVARAFVCQTATFHDPDDVRLVFARHPDNVAAWEWVKWLPHADVVTDRVSEVANLLADQVAARLARRRGRERPAGASGPEQLPRLLVIVDAEKLPLHDLDFRSHGVGLVDLDIHLIHLVADTHEAPRQVDQRIHVADAGWWVERAEVRQAFRPDVVSEPLALMLARQLARAPGSDAAPRIETRWLPTLRDLSSSADEESLWQQRLAGASTVCAPFTTYERKQPSLLRRLRTPRPATPTRTPARRWDTTTAPVAADLTSGSDPKPAASTGA